MAQDDSRKKKPSDDLPTSDNPTPGPEDFSNDDGMGTVVDPVLNSPDEQKPEEPIREEPKKGSFWDDTNITRTINPRDLSDEDAEVWNQTITSFQQMAGMIPGKSDEADPEFGTDTDSPSPKETPGGSTSILGQFRETFVADEPLASETANVPPEVDASDTVTDDMLKSMDPEQDESETVIDPLGVSTDDRDQTETVTDPLAGVAPPDDSSNSDTYIEEPSASATYIAPADGSGDTFIEGDPEATYVQPAAGDEGDENATYVAEPGAFEDDGSGATIVSDVPIDEDGMGKTIVGHADPSSTAPIGAGVSPTSTQQMAPGAETNLVIERRRFGEAKESATSRSDYEIVEKLGVGGMGIVYLAKQSSVDRKVAVKMIKDELGNDKHNRESFLSEAVVTGDLEHPNIVPIYDVGRNAADALFYSMKRVEGTPWDKVVREKSVPENLDILMKVADAIAFAHAKGVVHRDLKPENVMLGGFGEVLVMDWGLALLLPDSEKFGKLNQSGSMGGTPAYMPPELLTGPIERIGPYSDVYLLGAILYEAVAGKPPHSGRNLSDCINAALNNRIDETDKSGELLDIALKAMATKSEDRYQTVIEFQTAIRDYQSHFESLALSTRAEEDLESARASGSYEDYNRALFGYQEAISLWDSNTEAHQGLDETKITYAQAALDRGDFDLGAGMLDAADPNHAELFTQIDEARQERDARQARLRRAKRVFQGMVVAIAIIIVVAGVVVFDQYQKAVASAEEAKKQSVIAQNNADEAAEQQKLAEASADEAKKQQEIAAMNAIEAQKSADEAKRQQKIADMNAIEAQKSADEAKKQQNLAQAQQKKAEENLELATKAQLAQKYEAYVAQIGLAEGKINDNAFVDATRILQPLQGEPNADWEWRRLWYLCKQAEEFTGSSEIEAVSYDKNGQRFATGSQDGMLRVYPLPRVTEISIENRQPSWEVQVGNPVQAVAYTPDGKFIATGDASGRIRIWDAGDGSRVAELTGHRRSVTSVTFSSDGGWLLSGSMDTTARLWARSGSADQPSWQGSEKNVLYRHTGPVWQAVFSQDDRWIATAGDDGRVVIWESTKGSGETPYRELTVFAGHQGPVYSAAFSPDATQVVTGGEDRRILMWKPSEVRPVDFTILTDLDQRIASPPPSVRFGHEAGVGIRNVSSSNEELFGGELSYTEEEHRGPVHAVAFSPDGKHVLSTSDDHSIKVWNADTEVGTLEQTLRGHGGWVRSTVFIPFDENRAVVESDTAEEGEAYSFFILSGSHDTTARIWNVNTYEEVRLINDVVVAGEPEEKTAQVDKAEPVAKSHSRIKLNHSDAVLGASFYRPATGTGDLTTRVVTASRDSKATLWNLSASAQEAGNLTAMRTLEEGHEFLASAALYFPRGTKALADRLNGQDAILTGAGDNSVRIWDAATGSQLAEMTNTGRNAAVAISSDGEWILTGSSRGEASGDSSKSKMTQANRDSIDNENNWAKLWKTSDVLAGTGAPVSLKAHRTKVSAVAFSNDGERFLTADELGNVILWERDEVKPIRPLHRHTARVNAAVFLPGDERFLTASDDRSIQVWKTNAKSTLPAQIRSLPHPGSVTALSASKGGDWALSVCRVERRDSYARGLGSQQKKEEQYQLALWKLGEADGGTEGSVATAVQTIDLHSDVVSSVSFSPDEQYAVTVSAGEENAELRNSKPGVLRWKLTKTRQGKQFGVLAQKSQQPAGEPLLPEVESRGAWQAVYSPDGKSVLLVGGNSARIWDLVESKMQRTFSPHRAVTSAHYSADGKYVITSSLDRTVKIWDAVTGIGVTKVEGQHTGPINSAAFEPTAPNGNEYRFLTASGDKTAILWSWNSETKAVEVIQTLAGHTAEVRMAVFSPDGKWIATASDDSTARLWNAETGEMPKDADGNEIGELRAHEMSVLCIAFSDDGKWLATGSDDKTARIWEFATGKEYLGNPLQAHSASVTSVAFSPHEDLNGNGQIDEWEPVGSRVLTGSLDKTVKLWDPRTVIRVTKEKEADAAPAEKNEGEATPAENLQTQRNAGSVLIRTVSQVEATDSAKTDQPESNGEAPANGEKPPMDDADEEAKEEEKLVGKELLTLREHSEGITSVQFSPDGHYVLTASMDGQAVLWLALDPQEHLKIKSEKDAVKESETKAQKVAGR